ncbi:MFS transporter [Pedobacter panaciterrae]
MKINAKPLLITLTLGILTAIGSISIDIYLPAFGVMANYFKVPIVRIEGTVTLFLFGMSFGQLFIGPMSDVWGRKTPLRVGLAAYVLCSICCVITSSFPVFLTLRFIQGLAGSACQVICRALVGDIYKDKNAAHVFTVLQIIMGVSPILSPIAERDVSRSIHLEIPISNYGSCFGSRTNRMFNYFTRRKTSGC